MMNDSVAAKLRQIIVKYGLDVCTDPRRLEGLLRDFSAGHRREISVLTGAAREGVPAELLAVRDAGASVVLMDRLALLLQDNLALTDEAARWAVAAWASALAVKLPPQAASNPGRSVSQTGTPRTSGQASQGSSRVAEALFRIANDPDNDLPGRLETAERLAKVDQRRAADVLYDIATDDDNDIEDRLDVADKLIRMDKKRGAEVLHAIAADDDVDVLSRIETAEKLGQVDPERAADVLYDIATDDDNDIEDRLDAADKLARIDAQRATGINRSP